MTVDNRPVISDFGKGTEKVEVVRYLGSSNIRQLIQKGEYIAAYTHTQLGIEHLLWERIVAMFHGEKASIVRRNIESLTKNGEHVSTHSLIIWARTIDVISVDESRDLLEFNTQRNRLIHGHGKWWNSTSFKGALDKGVQFLEKNGM